MSAGSTTYILLAFKWLQTTIRRDYAMHPKHNAHDKGHEKSSKKGQIPGYARGNTKSTSQ